MAQFANAGVVENSRLRLEARQHVGAAALAEGLWNFTACRPTVELSLFRASPFESANGQAANDSSGSLPNVWRWIITFRIFSSATC